MSPDQRRLTRTITITVDDLEILRHFAIMPSWVRKEFEQKFAEANVAPLPCDLCRNLVEQIEGPETMQFWVDQRPGGPLFGKLTDDEFFGRLAEFNNKLFENA